MLLSDASIIKALKDGTIVVNPTLESMIQPASIDLRLGTVFRFGWTSAIDLLNPATLAPQVKVDVSIGDSFTLWPGQCVLASTYEYVEIPAHLSGTVCGKSSGGRVFLEVHVTAGHIDPGFKGYITLELKNLNDVPIKVYPGDKICQMKFETLDFPAQVPYGTAILGSRYQGQGPAQPSRYSI